jgi:FlaG/FlaF family flagellin (archaellin)
MAKTLSIGKYRHSRRRVNDKSAVSEAIGTIILLAIAIALIGIVAVWVETLPQAPEHKTIDLAFTHDEFVSGQMTIDLEHQGGDVLRSDQTEIRIVVLPSLSSYDLTLTDSISSDFSDGIWDVGEHWNYTLTGLPLNAELELTVVDISIQGDRILYRKDLSLGLLGTNLPDLEITDGNISLIHTGELIRKDDTVTISARVNNLGYSNATAIVRFFQNNRLITSGDEFIEVDIPYKYNPSVNNYKIVNMTWTPTLWGNIKIGVKIYSLQYETNYANNYASKDLVVEFEYKPPHGPDFSISEFDINPDKAYPLHGEDLNISIIVHNTGDVSIPNGDVFNVSISLGNRTLVRQISTGLRARDSMETYMLFTEVGPGGVTEIKVVIDPEDTYAEIFETNNEAIISLQILPTILIVDDDAAEGGKYDVTNKLMKALKGRGVTYDFYNVLSGTDPSPRYDTGVKKLKNFDIVIWVTGYESEYTLTPTNIQHLKTWLDEPNSTNSLWMIGQDILNDTVASPGIVNNSDFAYEYLGIKKYDWDYQPEMLYGVLNDPITNGIELNTSGYLPNQNRKVNMTHRSSTPTEQIYSILGKHNLTGGDPSIAVRYTNLDKPFRTVYFGFEVTSILSAYDLSNITYQVLKWFNYSLEEGYDFGIVDQDFSTFAPAFMDILTISATVINNGPTDEEVYVLFYVTGENGQEYIIESYPDLKDNPQKVFVERSGGTTTVTKQWLASSVGVHNFRVVVDPYDQFQEIVEENNDFAYYGLDVSRLRIKFTVLIVDDDNSTNNGGPYPDTVPTIKDSLDDLNVYYEQYNVTGGILPGDGPSIDRLKHYNSVIWLTGNDIGPTLTETDQDSLGDYITGNYEEAKYLKVKVNILLVGQNILDDLNGSGNNIVPGEGFVKDMLKITEYSTDKILGNSIFGVQNNPISHGSVYPINKKFTDKADILECENNDKYLFRQNIALNQFNSINYEHEKNNSRVIFLPWELSFIDQTYVPDGADADETYFNELMYLMLTWFNFPRNSVEFKISDIDIYISEDNPNVGNSYIITTDIYNYGNIDSSVIVRYYDGNSIIDTDTVYVQRDSKSSSEIIWIPRYAGNRTISVIVDTEDDVPEVFDDLNNIALVPQLWVYFFYDDMEDGPSNWKHESTLIRINGESKLEYMDEPIYSNVNGSWNWSDSPGFIYGIEDYYSYKGVYYTYEPEGFKGKPTLDIILVFDTSNSMGVGTFPDRPIDDAKTAARHLLNEVTDESRVAIFQTATNEGKRNVTLDEEGWITLNEAGRETIMYDSPHYLNHTGSPSSELNPQSYTVLWTPIGEAIQAALTMGRPGKTAIIVLSDGQDFQGSDTGISDPPASNDYAKVEFGSAATSTPPPYGWCPWTNWGISTSFDYHWGKYFGTPTQDGYWYKQDFGPPSSKLDYASGLLSAPLPIYTVGLSLETATSPADINFPKFNYSDYGPGTPSSQSSDAVDVYNGPEGRESGTPEYNLFRIANTSGAKYYYAKEPDDLKNIFGQIADDISAILVRTTRSARSTSLDPEDEESLGSRTDSNQSSSRSSRALNRAIRRVVFNDDFETNNFLKPPWSADSYWSVNSLNSNTGIYQATGQGNVVNSILTVPNNINLSQYADVQIEFYQYTFNTDSSDEYYFDVSADGGATWTTEGKWDGATLLTGDYRRFVINLSDYDENYFVKIRFRFTSSQINEGWNIDDIVIFGNYSGHIGPGDRYLTTHEFSLENISSAKISFHHKYYLKLGWNGVAVMVGTPTGPGGSYLYEYTTPTQQYTGNFDLRKTRYDDFNNAMLWCWNGVSKSNLFEWEYAEVSLDNWTGLPAVKVRLLFMWTNWAEGGVYLIDDFEITVQHDDDSPMGTNSTDQWQMTTKDAHSGSYSWWNGDPSTGYLKGGIDNSLFTRSIDLTNARNATLSAYLKFNLNTIPGRPADGFRVELSRDNGINWDPINLGSRTAWGLSGNETDDMDDDPNDGKSYTGINSGNYWIETGSLTRLNCNLDGWLGDVIKVRFRVITSSDENPYFKDRHYDTTSAGFGGFYVDDVIIHGFSLQEG